MQKKFIQVVLKFILPLIVALVVVSFVLKKSVNQRCSYKLNSSITTLILGHSQPEHAFNDSLLKNTKNLCNGGEAYVYTYQKLKKVTAENPQVKTVLLSFSNNQIEEKMDDWTFGEKSMYQYYAKYSFMMDNDDYLLFIKNSFRNLLSAELKGMVMNFKYAYKGQNRLAINDFGCYLYSKRNKVDSLLAKNYKEDLKNNTKNKVSEVNIDYLKRIVQLCKEKHLKLVFIRTPIHPKFFETLDETKFQGLRKEKFNAIPFIDLHSFPLKNSEFGDFDHLNYKGAIKVSKYLNTLLNSET